jgi:hypothetical protein
MIYVFLLMRDKKRYRYVLDLYWKDNIIIYSIDMYFIEKKREIY